MPQIAPTQAPQQGLDPGVVNLAKAIRQTESGGNFQAQGKSGEYGAYQFTEPTWQSASQKYLGQSIPLNQATPEQQNQVAYGRIKDWKDQGYNVGQIASMWNAGEGEPNAYTGTFSNGSPSTGTNRFGVKYDVGAYAKSVATAYQTLKQGGQVDADPNNPSSTAAQQPKSFMDTLADAGKWGLNTFAPAIPDVYNDITGQSNKSFLQQLGDLGTTGLTAAAFLGAPEGIAARLGLEEGTAGAAAAGNAILGAGFGATGALGAGQTDPGSIAGSAALGGVTGGLIGGATQGLANGIEGLASETPESRLTDQTTRLKSLSNSLAKNPDAISTIASASTESGDPLISTLKVVDGKIDSTGTQDALQNLIDGQDAKATPLVQQIPGTVDRAQFQADVENYIRTNPSIAAAGKVPQTIAAAGKRFDSFAETYGDQIPWGAIDDIRTAMNKEWEPGEQDAARAIGSTARQYLYGSSGDPELKQIMADQGQYIQAKIFAKALHGTAVKGGRLGKYASEAAGGAVGTMLGSLGGPIGSAAGALGGGYVGEKVANAVQRSYFDPMLAGPAGSLQNFLNRGTVRTVGTLGKIGLLRSLTGSTTQGSP